MHMPAPSTPPLAIAVKAPVEALLFESATVAIGSFRCPTRHPLFRDSGPSNAYCFVFPRTAVWIRHADGAPFVAHPGLVTYYNQGQVYARRAVSPEGDHADWFAVAPHVVEDLLAAVAPRALGSGHGLFRHPHGPSAAAAYLHQRRLVKQLEARGPVDPLEVEEAVLSLLASLVAGCRRDRADCRPPTRAQRDLVEDAKALLPRTAAGRVHLAEIAARLSCSPFHLCRSFRRIEGQTMRAYRNDMRLRMSLLSVMDGRSDLSQIALDAGFSSHSHFTAAFRAHFGVTPSVASYSWRRDSAGSSLNTRRAGT